jgi:hypothetical protein
VANVVGAELAVGEVPHLDKLVPTAGHNDGVGGVGGEANARDPLGVVVLGDGVLALSKDVPQLDGLVARSRHDLAVVGREGNRQDIASVADETASAVSSGNLPQTQSLIPRARQSELTIGRDGNIRHEVRVSTESTEGNTIVGVIASKLPDDDGLVYSLGSRKQLLYREKQTGSCQGLRGWWQFG